MGISRRSFLRNSAIATLGSALPSIGISQLAFAQTATSPMVLVIVHLRGGCDGFNLISPATDPNFIAARAADLRVNTEGKDAGIALKNGPDATIDFRLHPAAAGLGEFYQQGQLAFIHAVGLTNETRSHFVATDMMERGVASQTEFARIDSGWLARYLRSQNSDALIPAISVANSASGELANYSKALALPTLEYGFGIPGGASIENLIDTLYPSSNDPVEAWGRQTLDAIRAVDRHLVRDAQNKVQPYKPDNGVDYGSGSEIGRGLKTAAQLIKMDIGLTAVSVEMGGWDTHEGQPGRFKSQVERLSSALGAFWNDMNRHHDNLLVVTVTEFGRRLRSNRSNGTDHGRAGAMMLMGGKIAGGRFYGPWPGLSTAQLDEGVDLAVATDYRQVLNEILAVHAGHQPSANVFPGYELKTSLGFTNQIPSVPV